MICRNTIGLFLVKTVRRGQRPVVPRPLCRRRFCRRYSCLFGHLAVFLRILFDAGLDFFVGDAVEEKDDDVDEIADRRDRAGREVQHARMFRTHDGAGFVGCCFPHNMPVNLAFNFYR